MMTSNNKKMLIFSSVIAVCIILLLIFMLLGLNLGAFKIGSISYLLSQYDLIKKSEKELTTSQSSYNNTLSSLEQAETEYNRQKNKYNTISDETINVIKEATTEETYNLEYMWIKLGNYAKKNNLEIVMIEPGGEEASTTNSSSSSGTNSSSTGTKATTTTNSSSTSSTSNSTSSATTSTASSGTTSGTTNSTNGNSTTSSTGTTSTTNQTSTSSDSSAFRVQIKGSYMNTSDFIFQVENDTALRFKLDNISMDYVEGTTIKTSFSVKNLTVNK